MILLPLYLSFLGASRTEIGTVMAAASVGGLCSRPLVGWALDAWGRKPTLIVGTILLSTAMGCIYWVTDTGWPIYLVRIIFGIGEGALFTGYFTFAADIVPEQRRTEGIALFGVSGLVPLIINPLSTHIGVDPPDLRWFFPILGLVVAASLFALVFVPETKREPAKTPFSFAEAWRSLRDRPLWSVWFASMIFAGLVSLFMAFTTVAAEKQGVAIPASLWWTYAGGAASVRIFGAKIPDQIGTHNMVTPALAAYVGALIVAASATSNQDFLLAGLLGGIGHGYCFPTLTSQVVTRVADQYRGSGLAMFTAIWGLSALLFTPVFGSIADHHGDSAMFLAAAVFGTASMFIWVFLEHRLGGAKAT
jgi:MFS family permease